MRTLALHTLGSHYSPLHDRKTTANTRNGRSYYVNASHRRGDRGRAPIAAVAHHDRLWGRSRRLIISPTHGASVEPQGAELQPRGPPPAASARPTAAAPETRAAEARADRRRRPSGPPPGAAPVAIDISGSRRIRRAARHRAATTWHATSSDHASARCRSCDGCTRGARRRARIGAAAHHGRLLGRSAALSAPTACGASNAPRVNVLRPSGAPLAASARRAAASHATAAAEAARRSPPLLTTAASWGDPRLDPHLLVAAHRTRRGLTLMRK